MTACTNLRIFLLSRGGAGRRDELIQGPTDEEPREGNSKQTKQESDVCRWDRGWRLSVTALGV